MLSAEELRQLAETSAAIERAGAQLGTSSQAQANCEHIERIDAIVAGMSDFYCRELASKLESP